MAKEKSARRVKYHVWWNMIDRCHNSKSSGYSGYGDRGIKVCERWRESFDNFNADVPDRPSASHSFDRINNEGNYEPGNCRWATRAEQMRNTRANLLVTCDGETKTLSEWAESSGISYATLMRRINRGLPPEVALTKSLSAFTKTIARIRKKEEKATQKRLMDSHVARCVARRIIGATSDEFDLMVADRKIGRVLMPNKRFRYCLQDLWAIHHDRVAAQEINLQSAIPASARERHAAKRGDMRLVGHSA